MASKTFLLPFVAHQFERIWSSLLKNSVGLRFSVLT
uniref:Uncharacterized protein n=1 Tax=Rhizophora mucronata TaxID=61149 RepID=A0A2P2QRT1_RHIMU